MQNRFKVLNIMLDQAQELNERGDTASASNIVQMVLAECSVILSEKVTEVEKHLAVITNLVKGQLFLDTLKEKPVKLADPTLILISGQKMVITILFNPMMPLLLIPLRSTSAKNPQQLRPSQLSIMPCILLLLILVIFVPFLPILSI
jgi:hypothetical protein